MCIPEHAITTNLGGKEEKEERKGKEDKFMEKQQRKEGGKGEPFHYNIHNQHSFLSKGEIPLAMNKIKKKKEKR